MKYLLPIIFLLLSCNNEDTIRTATVFAQCTPPGAFSGTLVTCSADLPGHTFAWSMGDLASTDSSFNFPMPFIEYQEQQVQLVATGPDGAQITEYVSVYSVPPPCN